MLIRCPKCNTGYNLPPSKLGPKGRTVRCVKCQHEWFQNPAEIESVNEEIKPPLPPINEQVQETAKTSATSTNKAKVQANTKSSKQAIKESLEEKKAKLKRRLITSLFSAFVAVLIVLGLLILLKGPVSSTVPAMKSFYSTIGLETEHHEQVSESTISKTGVVILTDQIERVLDEDATPTTYTFVGKVKNTNSVPANVPTIRVSLRNDKGVELDFWPAQVEKTTLEPNEEARFVCRFFNPPLDKIYEHKIYFIEDSE